MTQGRRLHGPRGRSPAANRRSPPRTSRRLPCCLHLTQRVDPRSRRTYVERLRRGTGESPLCPLRGRRDAAAGPGGAEQRRGDRPEGGPSRRTIAWPSCLPRAATGPPTSRATAAPLTAVDQIPGPASYSFGQRACRRARSGRCSIRIRTPTRAGSRPRLDVRIDQDAPGVADTCSRRRAPEDPSRALVPINTGLARRRLGQQRGQSRDGRSLGMQRSSARCSARTSPIRWSGGRRGIELHHQ